MLLLCLGGCPNVLFVEDEKNTCSDFMMDGLVVFADNVDAKFLIEFVRFINCE